jgi:hypothetical protein
MDFPHHVDVSISRALALSAAVKIAHHELAIAQDMTRTPNSRSSTDCLHRHS